MSEATVCPPSVVADTIMRTIELGVTITDAAVDDDRTTIFLHTGGPGSTLPGLRERQTLSGYRGPAVD